MIGLTAAVYCCLQLFCVLRVILKADRKTARPHRLDERILCGRAVAVGCAYGGPPYVRSCCSIVCGRRP